MSYLGAIGKVMKGSGIEELFNEVYAENTVQQIISGKSISRALRAHLPAESALISILFQDTGTVNIAEVNKRERERERERDHELQNFGFSVCIIFKYLTDSLLSKEHPIGHFTYSQLQIC